MARRKHRALLANPAGGVMSLTKKVAVSSLIVGGVAVAGALVINKGLSMLKDANGNPRLTGYKEAGAKVAAGVAGGVLLAFIPAVPAVVGAGLAIGGAFDGILEAYQQWQASRAASSSATHSAAGAFLPPGRSMPAGFAQRTQQSCAV